MTKEEIHTTIQQLSDNWNEFEKKYQIQQHNNGDEFNELHQRMENIEIALKRPDILYENVNKKDSNLIQLLRKGNIDNMEIKSFSSSENQGEGLIIPSLEKRIISNLALSCPVRRLANVITISSNALELVIQEKDFKSGWVAEVAERVEMDTPQLIRKKIPVHELYAQPKATQRLLDDVAINFEQWLEEQLTDSFSRAENSAFLNGDGNNKPEGIIINNKIKKNKFKEDKLSIQDLIDLISTLDEKFLQNSAFLMNRLVFAKIQSLVDGSGRLIWQPSTNEKRLDTIFGIPVFCCSELPVEENNQLIILGDFKAGYQIVDRSNITVVRDPYTEKPFIKFYAVKRVGGAVICPDAFKFLTNKQD